MFGGNMKVIGRLQGAAVVTAVVVGLVGFGASSAQAATEEDAATWIANAALNQLGVDVENPVLADAIASAVRQAVDAGLISVAVDDLADQAVDDPESVDGDEADDVIEDELEDQTGQWQDIATEWHEAFDEIKADFAECREAATDGADDCAHEFRYARQVNHVEAWLARHEAKLGDISTLPEEEQAKAQAKLDRQGAQAQARLDKAKALLERQTNSDDADGADDTEADDADGADTDSLGTTDNTKAKNAKADKANRGHHGSAENHGKSGR